MTAKIAALEDRSILTVRGDDRTGFLHALVTADAEKIEPGQAAFSALLTPQGKVLFDFLIINRGDHFLLDCEASAAVALKSRLRLYMLRRKVEIAIDPALSVAAVLAGPAPEVPGSVVFPDPRCEVLGQRIIAAATALARVANAASADYRHLRWVNGVAEGNEIGSGELFAHEANLDVLHGISFTKGCYMGQEVAFRVEMKEAWRTRIVPVTGPALRSGAPVMAGDQRLGHVLTEAGGLGLAILRLDRWQEATAMGIPLIAEGCAIEVPLAPWAREAAHFLPATQSAA